LDFFGVMDRSAIPEFFVYGVPARRLAVGFVHVETVRQRESIHLGRVTAHRHPQMAQITFWTSGRGVYAIEDETWTFSALTVSFVPAGIVHGFTIEPGTDAIVVSVAEDALAGIAGQSLLALDQPAFVSGHGEPLLWRKLEQAILAIQSEYHDALPGMETILPPMIAVALSAIARLASERQAIALPTPVALAGRLRRLVDRHFRDDWPVERYVAQLGSTRHLVDKAARDVLGMGVRQAVGERRLVEAKRLLLFTIRTVEDIAYDCGFNDPAYFSRFFRQATGLSPAAWRRAKHGAAGEIQ
jgi:AraC family transcriptional activator of pobA